MKKLWISILVLALVGGCVQKPQEAEQPEEPVVEEPTTTPEKEEQEQEPEQNTEPEKEIVNLTDILKIDTIEIEVPDDEKEDISFLAPFVIETPIIEGNSEDYEAFNRKMQENKEAYLNIITYEGETLKKSCFVTVQSMQYGEIASVIIKESGMLYGAGGSLPDYYSYHFDLSTGKAVSNMELLAMMGFDAENAYEQLTANLQEQGWNCCPPAGTVFFETPPECYNESYVEGFMNNYTVKPDENSVLYVNEKGELIILLKIMRQDSNYYVEEKLS